MEITRCVVVIFFYLAMSVHAAEELIALKAARMFDRKSNILVRREAKLSGKGRPPRKGLPNRRDHRMKSSSQPIEIRFVVSGKF